MNVDAERDARDDFYLSIFEIWTQLHQVVIDSEMEYNLWMQHTLKIQ